jgi:hypothetical protein
MKTCAKRFSQRSLSWKGYERQMNASIADEFKTLDQLNFSSQFYFIVGMFSWGHVNCIWSFQIFMRANYSPFRDPLFFPLLFVMLILCALCHHGALLLADVTHLWRPKSYKDRKYNKDGEIIEGDLGLLTRSDMDNEIFRHEFVKNNKSWFIRHLWDNPDEEESDEEYPSWDDSKVSDSTRQVAAEWLESARQRIRAKAGQRGLGDIMWKLYALQGDEEDDEAYLTEDIGDVPEHVKAIARRWIAKGRRRIAMKTGKALSASDLAALEPAPAKEPKDIPLLNLVKAVQVRDGQNAGAKQQGDQGASAGFSNLMKSPPSSSHSSVSGKSINSLYSSKAPTVFDGTSARDVNYEFQTPKSPIPNAVHLGGNSEETEAWMYDQKEKEDNGPTPRSQAVLDAMLASYVSGNIDDIDDSDLDFD